MKTEKPDVEFFTPEQLGWVHKGGDVYEMPDGKLYIFPPKGQHILQKWVGKWPPIRGVE